MENYQSCFIWPNQSIFEAMKIINDTHAKVALVVNDNRNLLGIVTDGDIRRALIKGISLEEKVERIMSTNPTIVTVNDSVAKIKKILKDKELFQIPILNANKQVVGIKHLAELSSAVTKENAVLIMAGGYGKRLGDLTKDLPKPMLDVGGRPMLERIIESFKDYGFNRFFLSVFYKSEVIKNYFGDGSKFGVQIEYLEEKEALGTAGPLHFLKKEKSSILMINGDILTKANFESLLNYHKEQGALLTLCGTEYAHQVPYGVLDLEGSKVNALLEKPIKKYFVNTGIYVVEPEAISSINDHEKVDMNIFIKRLISQKSSISMFPLHEYWLDIGLIEQFEKAQQASKELF